MARRGPHAAARSDLAWPVPLQWAGSQVAASVLAALLLSSSLLLLPTREAWRYIPAEHSERGKKHGTVAPSTC